MMKIIATEQEKEEYLAYKCEEDVINNFEDGLSKLMYTNLSEYTNSVLLCGAIATFDRGIFNFINKFSENMLNSNDKLFLLSEVTAEYRRYTQMNIKVPFICTPHLLAKEMIITNMNIQVSDTMRKLILCKQYLLDAVKNLNLRHPQLGQGYAENWVYYAYKYITLLLIKLKPSKVILWNQFYAFHYIFRAICREKNIKCEYMEFGCLPGTLSIDECGQQGESMVAKSSLNSIRYLVTSKDISYAEVVINYLRESGLNRNPQPNSCFNSNLLKTYQSERKTILYFGQNDYESGMFPYTKYSKEKYSPIFSTTLETLEYLSDLAIKESWNFIYKPHPIMNSLGLGIDERHENSNINIITNVNINDLIDHVDVTITILSQSAYISLIRNKPVVMLGYTELRNKRCTYEAFNKKAIRKQIKNALSKGITHTQRKNFIKHVAQLIKYYLYDDLSDKPIVIGRKI